MAPMPDARPVRWWSCGAAWIDTLGSWTGYGFRASWEIPGLPICTLWRWHRGLHFFESLSQGDTQQ